MPQCIQCIKMNLNDKNKYGEALCKDRNRYYDPHSSACSNIEYANSSLKNREDEYEKESSSCYITTAVCTTLGLDDNCKYLMELRNFRDNYMMNRQECIPLLIEYEVIGPIISRHIEQDKDTAQTMLETYISKAIALIHQESYESAIETYKLMVEYLKNKYNLNNLSIDMNDIDFNTINQEPLNKEKVRTLSKGAKLIRTN